MKDNKDRKIKQLKKIVRGFMRLYSYDVLGYDTWIAKANKVLKNR